MEKQKKLEEERFREEKRKERRLRCLDSNPSIKSQETPKWRPTDKAFTFGPPKKA